MMYGARNAARRKSPRRRHTSVPGVSTRYGGVTRRSRATGCAGADECARHARAAACTIQPLPSGQVSGPSRRCRVTKSSGGRPTPTRRRQTRRSRRGRRSSTYQSYGESKPCSRQPGGHRQRDRAVILAGQAVVERHGEAARRTRASRSPRSNRRNCSRSAAVSPTAGSMPSCHRPWMNRRSCWRDAQVTLVPGAVRLQHAQLGEQLAHTGRALVRNRHVVRTPRIGRRSRSGPSASCRRPRAHLQQHEPIESALLQTPRGRQARPCRRRRSRWVSEPRRCGTGGGAPRSA